MSLEQFHAMLDRMAGKAPKPSEPARAYRSTLWVRMKDGSQYNWHCDTDAKDKAEGAWDEFEAWFCSAPDDDWHGLQFDSGYTFIKKADIVRWGVTRTGGA